MSDEHTQGHGAAGRHGTAFHLVEQARAAEARGDSDEAERLYAEAARIDPVAAAAALDEAVATGGADTGPASDEEVAAMSRTIEPRADAPSRAGISESGSGADGMGHHGKFPPG